MSIRPTVSVLIPTYNRASFLPGTLGSVFAQTVPVEEIVLVDDGSTDNTAKVLESLLAIHPGWKSRCHYVWQENQGKSVALNRALELAKGEWIAYLDSDDCWLPTKLEWQFRALARFPDCLACFTESSLFEFAEARRKHSKGFQQNHPSIGKVDEPSSLFLGGWPGTYMQTVLVRRNAMRRCGEFDPRLRMEQDADFLYRLGFVTDFCYVDLPLVRINREPGRAVGLVGNGSDFRSLERLQARELRLQKWLFLVNDTRPEWKEAIRNQLASYRSELANRFLLADNAADARRVLQVAMRECFEWRFVIKWIMTWAAPSLLRGLVTKRRARRSAMPRTSH